MALHPSVPQHYPHRYFEGDHVILSIGPEPRLFRIQRVVLVRFSETFRDMFSLPSAEGSKTVEGTSDDNPIQLPDDPDHFAGVLSVYYGTMCVYFPCISIP